MSYYDQSAQQTLTDLGVSDTGLSRQEASDRLLEYGPNIITVRGEPLWRKIVEPFVDIFTLVLAAAALVSLWHGEPIDAIIIAVIIAISAIIYYVQRFSTERVLRSLQKKDRQMVDVLRDHEVIAVDIAQIVPGDIMLLNEGERIAVDARLLETSSLRVDESQLTGESMPISKQIKALAAGKEVYEQSNMVFQGSFVVGGAATAVVTATGNNTEFGKLAVLSSKPQEQSPVQKKIDRLVAAIIKIIAGISVVALLLALYRGMDIAESVRYVLALAVSAVPESLPVAISVVLVLGMRRMAKRKALVKTMRSIETVGTLTVIATDKTGTLTKNKLTVLEAWHPRGVIAETVRAMTDSISYSESKTHDPLDVAMREFARVKYDGKTPGQIAKSLPFDQAHAMSGNVIHIGGKWTVWAKGAPEAVAARSKLTAAEQVQIAEKVREFAASGYRVIALAHRERAQTIASFDDIAKHSLTFDGLIAVADVLRPEAKSAIAQATRAGIRVCMITGDHVETAYHIASTLGIASSRDEVFDTRELHHMSDEELEKVLGHTRVFARVIPEHKHRILVALKKHHITAMTGDGVNDVPALTGAHVGFAMGSGASIAKDAGDIILLDDNFRSIVGAVHEGRTTYANIKRMVAYLLSTNAGEVLVALSALVIGVPVPLAAVQILWVNLVTDTFMAIPLGVEPGETRNMNRPPQKPQAPLFSRFMISRIIIVAVVMGALTMAIYLNSLALHGVEYARSVAFHALVVMQWASAFAFRSDYESFFRRIRRFSGAFYVGLGVAVAAQLLAMIGVLAHFLRVVPLSVSDFAWITAIAFVVPLAIVEVHKWIGRRFFNKGSQNLLAAKKA